MTERLRQWHFQLLLCRAREIDSLVEAKTPDAVREFDLQRQRLLEDFLHYYEGRVDSRMDSFYKKDLQRDWLHDRVDAYRDDSRALPELFEVFRHLRFDHQCDYVAHKLSDASDKVFWRFLKLPLLRQQSLLGGLASFCFVTVILCALGLVLNHVWPGVWEGRPVAGQWLRGVAAVAAIIGVAVRTIQEGLGITEDIERYHDYLAKVSRAQLRFQEAKDPKTKLELMADLELAAVDELKSFLRTHGRGRFAL